MTEHSHFQWEMKAQAPGSPVLLCWPSAGAAEMTALGFEEQLETLCRAIGTRSGIEPRLPPIYFLF